MLNHHSNYQDTLLWKLAFEKSNKKVSKKERTFMKTQYESMHDKVYQLLLQISRDSPEMTDHSIIHIEALWEIASKVIDKNFEINPTEGFVLGASMLIHDAGMTFSAYENGISDIKSHIRYKDELVRESKLRGLYNESFSVKKPPEEVKKVVVPRVLRYLHAERAEKLPTMLWKSENEQDESLINDPILRRHYGKLIGQIAKSHNDSVNDLELNFDGILGPPGGIPASNVNGLKLACILRIADVLHLDSRRAPSFLYKLLDLDDISKTHWNFQNKMAIPTIESEDDDEIVFTSGVEFKKSESNSWWLAYDMLKLADKEIKGVNSLLKSKNMKKFKINSIKGIETPEKMNKYIKTKDWDPVDVKVHISDVGKIVKKFGGKELYGNDLTVPLRELIQNAADAVQARRKLGFGKKFGKIRVGLRQEKENTILIVEDNGVGMSKNTLTGSLLDFGNSFWNSTESMNEFPGLLASGMNSIGKFGIGFFSIFMLGSIIKIYTRRYDKDANAGLLLEFTEGVSSKPILSYIKKGEFLPEGGTRMEIQLDKNPNDEGGLLFVGSESKVPMTLGKLVSSIVPCLHVTIEIDEYGEEYILLEQNDWKTKKSSILLNRICNKEISREIFINDRNHKLFNSEYYEKMMQTLIDEKNNIFGRAFIDVGNLVPSSDIRSSCLVANGINVNSLPNICGILTGNISTIDRKSAVLDVPKRVLKNWATNQAKIISKFVSRGESQADAAEIVLCCGGDIKNLKIIKINDKWMTRNEFQKFLMNNYELYIHIGEDIDYDYEDDNVMERDFYNYVFEENISFIKNNKVSLMQYYDSEKNISKMKNESETFKFIKKTIKKTWKSNFTHKIEKIKIASVEGEDINRYIDVFIRRKNIRKK